MERILFVCTGNTCRSPMAEAILKSKVGEEIEVKSAGISAILGDSTSKNTKVVLEKSGIHFDGQAKVISADLLEWATLVLTMTDNHMKILLRHFPKYQEKIHSFYGYVYDSNQDVLDPYGGTEKDYQNTFMELNDLIEKLIQKIM